MSDPIIIHTSSMPEWNGETNRVLMDLMAARDIGYDVALLSPENSALSNKAVEKGINVHHFSFDNVPHRRLGEIIKLHRLLLSKPASIIHTHSSKDTWLAAQQTMLFGKRFCFIRTRHNSNRVRDSFFNRCLYRRIDRIVVVSESVQLRFANLVEKGVIPADSIQIIPSAVDLSLFQPSQDIRRKMRSQLGVDSEDILLGFIGRVCEGKGIYHLIEALKALLPREKRLKFIAIGECSEDDIVEKLTALDGARVMLPGFKADIHNYYQAIDIVALPSLKEGLPTTIIEAMACGKAVVATNVGGIPEIINDGTNGLLVAPGDEAALVNSIQRLIDDEPLRRRLGEAAQTSASQNYSYDVLKQRIKLLYQSAEKSDGS